MSPFSQLTGRRRGSVWPMVGSVSGEEVPGLVLPPATGCVSLSFLWRVRGSVGSVPGRVGACEVESCCSLERLEQRPGDHLGRMWRARVVREQLIILRAERRGAVVFDGNTAA